MSKNQVRGRGGGCAVASHEEQPRRSGEPNFFIAPSALTNIHEGAVASHKEQPRRSGEPNFFTAPSALTNIHELGNGKSTCFWEDTWCGNTPLKLQFPRIYNLETERNCLIANRVPMLHSDWSMVLRHQCDSWQWSLGVAAGFSVASIKPQQASVYGELR
ncbi:hypothetical protein CTI12_AA135150 [Artemisia annua]|uniref:Uncharacterized protein n=1 Tax=Artemisia annua TaxID=35608 RepID=A0A2U1PMB8_ARTAN|nr:hypothetical protein CTI12_AA135150 [Artemisia annua]